MTTRETTDHFSFRLAWPDATEVPQGVDWSRALDIALTERYAGVAWHRNHEVIVACAPADVVKRWQGIARSLGYESGIQLEMLADTLDRLAAAGVPAMALKGVVLGQQLYGTIAARSSVDLDMYVAPPLRERAEAELIAFGWHRVSLQTASFDSTMFARESESLPLELHSTLWGEWLAHLPEPVATAESVLVEDRMVPTLTRALVPAYLGVHLLRHVTQPLLWFIDWTTRWETLTADEKADAREAARRSRLHRILDWGCEHAALTLRAADGDANAFRQLTTGRIATGPQTARELLLRSGTLLDRLALVGQVLWPRGIRHDPSSAARLWANRIGRRIGLPVRI